MKPAELVKKRKDLEASQDDLAHHSGIAQPNIAAMEKGRRPIGDKSAKKLEKALEIIRKENEAVVNWFKSNPDWMDKPELVEARRSAGWER